MPSKRTFNLRTFQFATSITAALLMLLVSAGAYAAEPSEAALETETALPVAKDGSTMSPETLKAIAADPVLSPQILKSLAKAAQSNSSVTTMAAAGNTYGDSTTITPDLFTGTFSYDFPIKVAPGRNGIEPLLVLNYRSSRTKYLGSIAYGMELELGSIERSAMGMGVNYAADDYLLHRSSGSMALFPAGNGTFKPVIEKEFQRIQKLVAADGKPYWLVTDKSGIRYTYGSTAGSRQENPSDSSKIFKWCLDHVEDTNGNYLTVTYFKDSGQIYIDRIDYTGNSDPTGPLSPTNQVKFDYEAKTSSDYYDYVTSTYTGFSIYVRRRLQKITITTPQDQLGRGYEFGYTGSSSLVLNNIQEFNSDRPDTPPPPTKFTWTYISNPPAASRMTSIANSSGGTTAMTYQDTPVFIWSNNGTYAYSTVVTLASTTTNDGNGNEATTTCRYSGGFHFIGTYNIYYVLESEFRGFNYAKVTGPVGPDNKQLITETWFHQGNDTVVDWNVPGVFIGYTKGLPYSVRVTDSTGKLYSLTATTYSGDADGGMPFYTPQSLVDTLIYDGDSTVRQTRTTFTYDHANGNLLREDQYGDLNDNTDDRTVVRTYSPNLAKWLVGLPVSETVYQGIGTSTKVAQTTYYYDDISDCQATPTNNQTPTKGNLTRVVQWNNRASDIENRTGYDKYGNAVCTRDGRGYITSIAYDGSFTFPTSIVNPLTHETSIAYYGVDGVFTDKGLYGQTKRVTDANNASINFEFDAFGRKTRVTSPDDSWTAWSYEGLGLAGSQRVRTEASTGEWQENYFDGFGRGYKTKSSGPDTRAIVRNTVYDLRGAVRQESAPYFEGDAVSYTTFDSDPLGRTTKVSRPDGTRDLICYNARLGATVTIDGENHRRREARDALGQLAKVEEYTGTYTACDASAGTPYATTTYKYDVLGNLRYVTDAKGNQTEARYDSLGRKYWMHDPDMGDWSYVHDANGNLISQTDAKTQTIGFVYDELNRLKLKDYPTGTDVVKTYDETTTANGIGRLTTMTDASGVTKYGYDQFGRATSVAKIVDGQQYSISATYDGSDRIKSLTYPDGETVDYNYGNGGNLLQVGTYATYSGYNAFGMPGTITFGNGATTTYQYYDTNARLKSIKTTSPLQGILLNLSYDNYYNDGNIKTITDALTGTRTQNFTYDELGRISQAQGSYGTRSYTYDQIGNIKTKDGLNYTYYSSRPHAVQTTSNGKTYNYDLNGNMTFDGQRTIGFDYDNLPSTINGSLNFLYDGYGVRVKKSSPSGTTTYIDKLYECTATGCTKFIFADGYLIAHKKNGQTYFYHSDHLGSTSIVTDGSGNNVEEIKYDPFGKTCSDTGSVQVNHLYTGQELDLESGLYNYNARLYNAELGRFVSADTIVPDPSDPQSLNRYSYVQNNPVMYVDPTGHITFTIYPDPWWWYDPRPGGGGGGPPPCIGCASPPGSGYSLNEYAGVIWASRYDQRAQAIGGYGTSNYTYGQNNLVNNTDPVGHMNITKTAVGLYNIYRGISNGAKGAASMMIGVAGLGSGLGWAPGALETTISAYQLGIAFPGLTKRGLQQFEEGLTESPEKISLGSFHNLLGVAPLGAAIDDPNEKLSIALKNKKLQLGDLNRHIKESPVKSILYILKWLQDFAI